MQLATEYDSASQYVIVEPCPGTRIYWEMPGEQPSLAGNSVLRFLAPHLVNGHVCDPTSFGPTPVDVRDLQRVIDGLVPQFPVL